MVTMIRGCGKTNYSSKLDAMLGLARIDGEVRKRGQSFTAPTECYYCKRCRSWHLTSLPRR